ncbi:phosphohistidine phosphatase SixA [Haemophilus paracuniculus]|uniref:Phosphohistidine phosphatase SixA n=1 Tax=Haemophilus paracuniculus TaxID=734 RepID=A0A1T0AUG3_9PAST|nr:phosphohistidine phosphatase SixA [Haemophilus paracuniculus]OOS00138.1 phosphohistidine phosphatase SixA [Haemophilus paracuniculus]
MNIWIMRHGEAGFNASKDSERTLTEFGQAMAEQQGQWLGKRLDQQNLSLDKILVSPYQRAKQTWQEVERGLQAVSSGKNFSHLVEEWDGITPAGEVQNVLNYAHFLRDEGAKNLLIISHLPLVFDLVQAFTEHQHSVHFYPAVIAEIDWRTDAGKLVIAEKP